MSIQTRTTRSKIAAAMASVFVLAITALPLFAGVVWVKETFSDSDPRKVGEVASLQVRHAGASAAPLPFEEPIVTVTFDDGWETIFSQALPLLQQYGIPTTQYILGGTFDNPLYMSVAQIRAMQKAGHEIAAHTMTHRDLTHLNDADLYWELAESKEVLVKEFGTIKEFASPLGAFDTRTIDQIKHLYRSQRNTAADPAVLVDGNDVNVRDTFDAYNIIAYTVRSTTTAQDIEALLEYTVQHNGWLVLNYHQVDENVASKGEVYGVTPAMLRAHLQQIVDRPVRVDTIGNVLDAIERRQ
jgi:peptidoglycan/xylan/chitin deacetylase (PgdA/CDA1 family)